VSDIDMDLDKWMDLRNNYVEVVIGEYASKMELSTLQKIRDFELRTNISLPLEYIEYCIIFGTGIFGINGFWIMTPLDYDSLDLSEYGVLNLRSEEISSAIAHLLLSSHQDITSNFKNGCKWTSKIQTMLDTAFVFGEKKNDKKTCFVFDLNSYSKEDLSCDIYGIVCDGVPMQVTDGHRTGVSYFLGRCFFDFIKDICIGDRAQQEFPELLSRDKNNEVLKQDYWNRKTFIVHGGIVEELDKLQNF
jgi:hypothetical protein